jgi:hypothetical protein
MLRQTGRLFFAANGPFYDGFPKISFCAVGLRSVLCLSLGADHILNFQRFFTYYVCHGLLVPVEYLPPAAGRGVFCMTRLGGLTVALAVFGALQLTRTAAQAADPVAAKAAAKALLEKGWDKTAAARAVVAW